MMLQLRSRHVALAPPTQQPIAPCVGSLSALARRRTLVGRRRSDVAADAEGPSTSSAVSAGRWRPQIRPASQRFVAASALPTAAYGGQPLASASNGSDHDKVGVVIVDHGSRKKASNDMLVEFADLYGKVTGQEIVEIAHMEIAEPTIEEAVGRCAARGARTVVIAPYFLSRGRHIQEDIPALVREARARHSGLHCVIAQPIGIDVLMVQLIRNRVAAALSTAAEAAEAEACPVAVAAATAEAA